MLLSVSGNLYANTNLHNVTHTLHEVIDKMNCNDADANQKHYDFDTTFLKTPLEKEVDLIFATDVEVFKKYKSVSIKKKQEHSSYYRTIVYANQLRFLFTNVKKQLPQNKFFDYSQPLKLNILLSIFLI